VARRDSPRLACPRSPSMVSRERPHSSRPPIEAHKRHLRPRLAAERVYGRLFGTDRMRRRRRSIAVSLIAPLPLDQNPDADCSFFPTQVPQHSTPEAPGTHYPRPRHPRPRRGEFLEAAEREGCVHLRMISLTVYTCKGWCVSQKVGVHDSMGLGSGRVDRKITAYP
jgi:hypothetical protein